MKAYLVYGGRSVTGKQNCMVAVRQAPLLAFGGIEAARGVYDVQSWPGPHDWLKEALRAPRRTLRAATALLARRALKTQRHVLCGGLSLDDSDYLRQSVRFGRNFSVSVEGCLFVAPGARNATAVIDVAARGIRVVETLDADATTWALRYEPVGSPFSYGASTSFTGEARRLFQVDQLTEMSVPDFLNLTSQRRDGVLFLDFYDGQINPHRPVLIACESKLRLRTVSDALGEKDVRNHTFWDRLVIFRKRWYEIGGDNLMIGVATNGRWSKFERALPQSPLAALLSRDGGILLWKPFVSNDDLDTSAALNGRLRDISEDFATKMSKARQRYKAAKASARPKNDAGETRTDGDT
mmetsp:Transcript_25910/g.103581  ORF Transcript_25910/g.103581 Transcript_25910/m.103581 type:complete len:353 (+) Transcript_25910:625-1683(+)